MSPNCSATGGSDGGWTAVCSTGLSTTDRAGLASVLSNGAGWVERLGRLRVRASLRWLSGSVTLRTGVRGLTGLAGVIEPDTGRSRRVTIGGSRGVGGSPRGGP